ncbi:MAG: hypothetical protein ACLS4Z_06985 [Christensenellaceae bacterium]
MMFGVSMLSCRLWSTFRGSTISPFYLKASPSLGLAGDGTHGSGAKVNPVNGGGFSRKGLRRKCSWPRC